MQYRDIEMFPWLLEVSLSLRFILHNNLDILLFHLADNNNKLSFKHQMVPKDSNQHFLKHGHSKAFPT